MVALTLAVVPKDHRMMKLQKAAAGVLLLLVGSAAGKDCSAADIKFDDLWIDPTCDGKLNLYGSNLGDDGEFKLHNPNPQKKRDL